MIMINTKTVTFQLEKENYSPLIYYLIQFYTYLNGAMNILTDCFNIYAKCTTACTAFGVPS